VTTIDACKREVIEVVASAMYLRNDVLDVKSSRRIVPVQPAVACVLGRLTNSALSLAFIFQGMISDQSAVLAPAKSQRTFARA
jgi:hypothetical protein